MLSGAASDVIAKIAAVVPERLQPFIAEPSVGAKPSAIVYEEVIDIVELRRAIREGRKLLLNYRSESGEVTERTVWPVILGYSEATRMIVAWCELRQGFRHFRTDRVITAEVLEETNGLCAGELRRRWEKWRMEQFSGLQSTKFG